MKNCTIRKPLASSILMMLLVLWQFSTANAQSYDLPITGSDAVRCGAGELTLTVSWSDAALSPENVKWYTVPFYGTPIASGMSYTTPYIEFTQIFYVDYLGEDGCSQCDRLLVRAVIADQVITPQVIYPSLVFCNSGNESFTPIVVGASGGTFEVSPTTGLTVNSENGSFNPYGATTGTYLITFTPDAIIGCDNNPANETITITEAPIEPEIVYGANSYCTEGSDPTPTITGAAGGTFTSVPAGLSINSTTGTIDLSESGAGTYTISYLIAGGGGCSPVSDQFDLTIIQYPSASMAYDAPSFTKNQTSAEVTLTGAGDFAGGSYSFAGSGGNNLSINTETGEINPSSSDAGTYTVTYTKQVTGVCVGTLTTEVSVVIYPLPAATIAGAANVCQGQDAPEITFTGSLGTPPYTFGYNINNGILRTVTSEESSETAKVVQPGEEAGTYTYTLVSVTDANGSMTTFDTPESVVITIIAIPSADFFYLAAAYCQTGTAAPELSEGAEAGTFTASPAGLVFTDQNTQGESLTGTVDLAATASGTYTITNAIDICGIETATTTISVSEPPTVDIVGTVSMTYGAKTTYSGPEGENYTYQWEVIGVATLTSSASARNVDVQATDIGQFTLKLTITDAIGCTNSNTKTVDVHQAELLVVGTQHTKDYDGVAISTNDLGHTFVGFVFDDTGAVVSGAVTYEGGVPNAIGAVDAGEYAFIPVVSGLSAVKYTFTPAYGNYVINPVNLTVTADDKTVHYGDSPPALTYTLSGFVNGEDETTLRAAVKLDGEPTLSTTYTNTMTVSASPVDIIVEDVGTLSATNYTFSNENTVSGTLTIDKAPLSVTADDKFKEEGVDDPTFTVTYSGFVNDEDENILNGILEVNRVSGEVPGTYTITPSGLSSDNYIITFSTGTLTIGGYH